MSGTPFVGRGVLVNFGTSSPMTELLGVTGVSFTGDKVGTEKTTDMLTPGGNTYIASDIENGTVDIKCWLLPGDTSQEAMETARVARNVIPFVVTLPGVLGTRSFSGIVESGTVALPLDKNATIDYKVKVSGDWTDTF